MSAYYCDRCGYIKDSDYDVCQEFKGELLCERCMSEEYTEEQQLQIEQEQRDLIELQERQ